MKKQIIRGIWSWIKTKVNHFVLGIMFITVVILQVGNMWDKPVDKQIDVGQNVWQESFDLTVIPTGVVVWSHGVPGTEADFKHSKLESTRYYYFDMAILTKDKIIHVVRVPYYVMGVINPNGVIDFKKESKKNGNLRNL